jgi:hypothetical protein
MAPIDGPAFEHAAIFHVGLGAGRRVLKRDLEVRIALDLMNTADTGCSTICEKIALPDARLEGKNYRSIRSGHHHPVRCRSAKGRPASACHHRPPRPLCRLHCQRRVARSMASRKVRCVAHGRECFTLSAHRSLGFIGRQIKVGSPQWRQGYCREGGDRCAPPQFLLRHGFAP